MAEIAVMALSFAKAAAPFVATAASVASVALAYQGANEIERGGQAVARTQALDAELAAAEADQERLAGDEAALRIKRDALKRIGQARVAFAGSGLDISSGFAIEDSIEDDAGFELSIARSNTKRRAAIAEVRSASSRIAVDNTLTTARAEANSQRIGAILNLARRG